MMLYLSLAFSKRKVERREWRCESELQIIIIKTLVSKKELLQLLQQLLLEKV